MTSERDGPEELQLADHRGELVGKRVAVKEQVSADSGIKAVFTKLKAVCSRCGAEGVYDASTDPRRLYGLMVGETIGQIPHEGDETCGESGKPHYWIVKGPIESPSTYQSVLLRDATVQDRPSSGATTGSLLAGHLLGKVPQNKDVVLEGTLVVNPRNSKI